MRPFVIAVFFLAAPAAHAQSIWDSLTPSLEVLANPEKYQELCRKDPSDRRCRPTSGAELMARCDSSESTDRAYCAGALDAMAMAGRKELPEWRCVPSDVFRHPEQLRVLFVREGHRTPEVLHRPARDLLFYAVAKSFPCRKPQTLFR